MNRNDATRLLIGWCMAGLACLPEVAFQPGTAGPAAGFLSSAAAGLGLALCLGLFVQRGGNRIDADGMIFFSIALFIFFPALTKIGLRGADGIDLILSTSFLLLVLALWALLRPSAGARLQDLTQFGPLVARRAFLLLYWLVASVFLALGLTAGPLKIAGQFGTIGMICVAIVATFALRPRVQPVLWISYAVAAGALLVTWYLLIFTGFGRIVVASVLLFGLSCFSTRALGRTTKLLALLLLPLGMIWGARLRAQDGTRAGLDAEGGLYSLHAPYLELRLIYENPAYEFWQGLAGWFDQLLLTLLFWFPRDLWTTKPEGFGRLMTYVYRPDLSNTIHSMAGSWVGEAHAFFGVLAFPVAVASLVFLRTGLNRFENVAADGRRRLQSMLSFAAVHWASVQLLTFIWGGMFSYMVRVGYAFLAIAALFLCYRILQKAFPMTSSPFEQETPSSEAGRRFHLRGHLG